MRIASKPTTPVCSTVALATAVVTLFAGSGIAAGAQSLTNYATYVVTNVHSGLALSDPGSSNTDAEFMEQQGVASDATNQQWAVTNQGGGVFTLTNASSGQFLDVYQASHASGGLVDQWPSNGNSNQNWSVVSVGDGHYEVISQNSGLALSVAGGGTNSGAEIEQATYTGSASQQWIFTPQASYSGGVPTSTNGGSTTFTLTALASGNWNSNGQHIVGNYQVGFSNQLPNESAAYFEFDLSPIQGRTVNGAELLIPGSTDYDIGVSYSHTSACTTTGPCFKIGIGPQNGYTTEEIVSPSSNSNVGLAESGIANQNQDIGYQWVNNGLHLGMQFGAWTYNTSRLQDEVNTGGDWVFWGRDDFNTGLSNLSGSGACPACPGGFENYIWGSTGYNTGIKAFISVEGGAASIPVVPSGTYAIKNLNSGATMEIVAATSAAGTDLDQAAYTGDSRQLWKVTRLADGNYTITSVNTGRQLDASNSIKPWEAARISQSDKTNNQEWAITPATEGNYTIKSVGSGLLLDVASNVTLNGAGIVLGKAQTGFASQQWSFKPFTAVQHALLSTRDSNHGSL